MHLPKNEWIPETLEAQLELVLSEELKSVFTMFRLCEVGCGCGPYSFRPRTRSSGGLFLPL